jgi:phage tail-like protein
MADYSDAYVLGAYFSLVVDGVSLGEFTSVSGISMEFDVANQQAALKTGKVVNKKVPASRAKYAEISLKRGFSADDALLKWHKDVVQGKATPYKTGSITVFSTDHKPLVQFAFERMWPSKLSCGDLEAGSTSLLIEDCTIQHDHMEWK